MDASLRICVCMIVCLLAYFYCTVNVGYSNSRKSDKPSSAIVWWVRIVLNCGRRSIPTCMYVALNLWLLLLSSQHTFAEFRNCSNSLKVHWFSYGEISEILPRKVYFHLIIKKYLNCSAMVVSHCYRCFFTDYNVGQDPLLDRQVNPELFWLKTGYNICQFSASSFCVSLWYCRFRNFG